MTWLSGWGKRIKLTLDSFRVDEDLTDFPVLLTLSSGTGKNDADVTNIFDELFVHNLSTISGASNEYLIDYSDGYTITDTAGTNDGTITNSNIVEGHLGQALEFGSVVSTVRNVIFDSNIDDWVSVSFWTKRGSTSLISNFFMNSAQDKTIACTATGDFLYTYDGGQNNSNLTITDNTEWHHVVCVVESSSTLRFYLDKVKASSAITWTASDVKYVGRHNASGGQEVPYMDQIRFYNYKLSQSEIDSLYDESITGNKKVMITTSESIPCYTEVERWDWVNEQAWLWVKVPTIVSGTDTELYLYYDSTHADNSEYIGDTGEIPAQNVWDDNFDGVWHMSQDPSGGSGAIKDSTNSFNCTAGGSMDFDNLVNGKIGKSLDFSSDYLTPGSEINSLDFTIEAIVNPDSFLTADEGKNTIFNSGRNHGILQLRGDAGKVGKAALLITVGSTPTYYYSSSAVSLGAWSYLAGRYSESLQSLKLHVNTTLEIDQSVNGANASAGGDAGIGCQVYAGPNRYVDGQIDELRVSQIARSDAWIKTTYYSNWNNFVTFGAEEEEPIYYLDGYVKENNQPVSRDVKLYRRDTGALVGYDTSRLSDGYYYLTTPSSGTHFIVAFDDDAGEEFNALILDKVSIKGTV